MRQWKWEEKWSRIGWLLVSHSEFEYLCTKCNSVFYEYERVFHWCCLYGKFLYSLETFMNENWHFQCVNKTIAWMDVCLITSQILQITEKTLYDNIYLLWQQWVCGSVSFFFSVKYGVLLLPCDIVLGFFQWICRCCFATIFVAFSNITSMNILKIIKRFINFIDSISLELITKWTC